MAARFDYGVLDEIAKARLPWQDMSYENNGRSILPWADNRGSMQAVLDETRSRIDEARVANRGAGRRRPAVPNPNALPGPARRAAAVAAPAAAAPAYFDIPSPTPRGFTNFDPAEALRTANIEAARYPRSAVPVAAPAPAPVAAPVAAPAPAPAPVAAAPAAQAAPVVEQQPTRAQLRRAAFDADPERVAAAQESREMSALRRGGAASDAAQQLARGRSLLAEAPWAQPQGSAPLTPTAIADAANARLSGAPAPSVAAPAAAAPTHVPAAPAAAAPAAPAAKPAGGGIKGLLEHATPKRIAGGLGVAGALGAGAMLGRGLLKRKAATKGIGGMADKYLGQYAPMARKYALPAAAIGGGALVANSMLNKSDSDDGSLVALRYEIVEKASPEVRRYRQEARLLAARQGRPQLPYGRLDKVPLRETVGRAAGAVSEASGALNNAVGFMRTPEGLILSDNIASAGSSASEAAGKVQQAAESLGTAPAKSAMARKIALGAAIGAANAGGALGVKAAAGHRSKKAAQEAAKRAAAQASIRNRALIGLGAATTALAASNALHHKKD
jgi:hypothetical protein